MTRISGFLLALTITAIGFISAPCLANEESIAFKSFFCTSTASNSTGITTLTFTGRNPLSGKDTFSLSTVTSTITETSSPVVQTLLLSGFNHEGPQLQLNFRTVLTNSEMSLHLNSTINLIQLDIGNGSPLITMTCKVNMDLEN